MPTRKFNFTVEVVHGIQKIRDATVKAKHVLVWMFPDNFRPSFTVFSKFSSMGKKTIFRESVEEPLFRPTGNLPSV